MRSKITAFVSIVGIVTSSLNYVEPIGFSWNGCNLPVSGLFCFVCDNSPSGVVVSSSEVAMRRQLATFVRIIWSVSAVMDDFVVISVFHDSPIDYLWSVCVSENPAAVTVSVGLSSLGSQVPSFVTVVWGVTSSKNYLLPLFRVKFVIVRSVIIFFQTFFLSASSVPSFLLFIWCLPAEMLEVWAIRTYCIISWHETSESFGRCRLLCSFFAWTAFADVEIICLFAEIFQRTFVLAFVSVARALPLSFVRGGIGADLRPRLHHLSGVFLRRAISVQIFCARYETAESGAWFLLSAVFAWTTFL